MDVERGEKTPLLKADPEPSNVTVEGDFLHSCTFHGELLSYDQHRAVTWLAFLWLGHSVFASRTLWCHVFAYFALGCVVAAAALGGACTGPRCGEVLDEAASRFAILVALVLAMHTSLVVGRWLEMRHHILGELWSAVNTLATLLGAHFPEPENKPLKTLVLRYCLVSFDLLFEGDGCDLAPLTKKNLLSDKECSLLQPLPAKPEVLWVWVTSVFQRLAEGGKLSSRLLVHLYQACANGRRACGGVRLYRQAQLPLAYIHLISTLVQLSCAAVACRCGGNIADALRRHDEGGPVVVCEVLLLVGAPLLYVSLLRLGCVLEDPFAGARAGEATGFPRSACHVFMRDECEAFHTAGEEQPKAIARVVEQLVVEHPGSRPGTFVHDRVEVMH